MAELEKRPQTAAPILGEAPKLSESTPFLPKATAEGGVPWRSVDGQGPRIDRLRGGALQRQGGGSLGADAHTIADSATSGGGGALPHGGAIQQAFGHHDVSGISAHTGAAATQANEALGSKGFAKGNDVAFKGTPDLHTAAHEAAHVVQQRAGVHLKGDVGQSGDAYERHADAVADAVVAGGSAEALLDAHVGGGAQSALQQKADGALQFDGGPGLRRMNALDPAALAAVGHADPKAKVDEEVATLAEVEAEVVEFTVTFVEQAFTTPHKRIKPYIDRPDPIQKEAKDTALFIAQSEAEEQAKAQISLLTFIAERVKKAPTEEDAQKEFDAFFGPRLADFSAVTAEHIVVKAAADRGLQEAESAYEAYDKRHLTGLQVGGGDADLAAMAAGDGTQDALGGSGGIDIRANSGNLLDKDDRAKMTEANEDLGSKDVDIAGAGDDWGKLIQERNIYGMLMKSWGDLGDAQGDWAGQAAKDAKAALTFGQTGVAGGALKAGLGGMNFDSKSGTLSANLAKWTLLPPYPPLAQFATPLPLAPGLGVTLEAVVNLSVAAKGGISLQREGYDAERTERAKAGGLMATQKEREAKFKALNAKVEEINQKLADIRAANGDTAPLTAQLDATKAEKTVAEEAIILKAGEIRDFSAGLMKQGDSKWRLGGSLEVGANLTGEIFAGGFIGIPLVNIGAGIYAELGTNLKGKMGLSGQASFKKGESTPTWDGLTGDLNAMARATAAIGAKVKYQFIFVSGDIWECTFADWTLGVMEYAGQMKTSPGLSFETTKKEAHFGDMPPVEKKLIQAGEEATHFGDKTGKKVTELNTSGDATSAKSSEVHLETETLDATARGFGAAKVEAAGGRDQAARLEKDKGTAESQKSGAEAAKGQAEAGRDQAKGAAATEETRAGRLDNVAQNTQVDGPVGIPSAAGMQAGYQENLAGLQPQVPHHQKTTESRAAKAKPGTEPAGAAPKPAPNTRFKAAALTIQDRRAAVRNTFKDTVAKASAAGSEEASGLAEAHKQQADALQGDVQAQAAVIQEAQANIAQLVEAYKAQQEEIRQADQRVADMRARVKAEALHLEILMGELAEAMAQTKGQLDDLRLKRVQARGTMEALWKGFKSKVGAYEQRSDLDEAMNTAQAYHAEVVAHKARTDGAMEPKIQQAEADKAKLGQDKAAAEQALAAFEAAQKPEGTAKLDAYKAEVAKIETAEKTLKLRQSDLNAAQASGPVEKAKAKVKEIEGRKPKKGEDAGPWNVELTAAKAEVKRLEADNKALVSSLEASIKGLEDDKKKAKTARDDLAGNWPWSRDSVIAGYKEHIAKIDEIQKNIEAGEKEIRGYKLAQTEAREMLEEADRLVAQAQSYIDDSEAAGDVLTEADTRKARAARIRETAVALAR